MRKQTIPLLIVFSVAMLAVVPSSPAFAEGEPRSNQFWWPENLSLNALRDHGVESNPMGDDFNYAEARQSPPTARGSVFRTGLLFATQSRPTLREVALAAERSLPVDQDLCHLFPARFANDNARYVLSHRGLLSTRFLGVPWIPGVQSVRLCVGLSVQQ